MSGEFRKAFKGVDAAIKQGTARALNRALSSARTQMTRDIREETGLKNADISDRVLTVNAKSSKLSVLMGIAIKVGVRLSKFSPLSKKVKVLQKNGRLVTHYGVTARVGSAGRQLVAGAFFLVGKTGEAVIGRKGAYSDGEYTDPTAPKYATAQLRSNVLAVSAAKNQPAAQKKLIDAFNDNVSHEIEYAVQSKFDENK